jgi:hypothetical protein
VRRKPEFFEDRELVLVYIAKKLKDALALEAVLTEATIDYAIETDHYTGGVIFRSQRVGAFFYVLPEAEETTRRVMTEHGYKPQGAEGA